MRRQFLCIEIVMKAKQRDSDADICRIPLERFGVMVDPSIRSAFAGPVAYCEKNTIVLDPAPRLISHGPADPQVHPGSQYQDVCDAIRGDHRRPGIMLELLLYAQEHREELMSSSVTVLALGQLFEWNGFLCATGIAATADGRQLAFDLYPLKVLRSGELLGLGAHFRYLSSALGTA